MLFSTVSPCVPSGETAHHLLSHCPYSASFELCCSCQKARTVNYQSQLLRQRCLTGVLADGLPVQWSSPATSRLGGRDCEAHPDFKDSKVCITILHSISAVQIYCILFNDCVDFKWPHGLIMKENSFEIKLTMEPSLNDSPDIFLIHEHIK